MAKTLDQVTKAPQQIYRTKEENQPAFRPRYDVQQNKVRDASRDVTSLLGSTAKKTQQEHEVSVGIAKRMASDHIMALDEEIKFVDGQLKDTDSRDIAIKRLQGSIATTSGVSAGLTGDAAQAYDEMYIGAARKMATNAMSKWDGQQTVIDKNTLTTEFKTFMDSTYSDLDSGDQQLFLAAWGERFSSFGDVSFQDIENVGIGKLTDNFTSMVKADPEGNHIEMANRVFDKYGKIEDDGTITYHTNNVVARKAISDAVYSATQPRIKAMAAQKLREANVAYQSSIIATGAHLKAFNAELKSYTAKYGGDMEDDLPEAVEKYEAKKAELIKKHGINGTGEANDKAIYNKVIGLESGGSYTAKNPKSSAYGKYQFTTARAKDMWKAAGIQGRMVHGTQTPAQQERMWQAQLSSGKRTLARLGREATPGNFYIVHQLGDAGAKRYFQGNLNTKDIEDMNVNTGSKHAVPALHRAEILAAWRSKHLSGEMTEAQAITSKSLIDIASDEVAYRESRGDIKDAKQDLETAKFMQTKVNEGTRAGTMTKEDSAELENKIDELITNSNLAPREREQFYSEQAVMSDSIGNTLAAKEEAVLVDKLHAETTVVMTEDPKLQYQDAFKIAATREGLKPDHSFKYYANQLSSFSAMQKGGTKQKIEDTAEFRKTMIESPLLAIENTNTVTADQIATLDPYYDKMSEMEQVRYKNAAEAYLGTQNYILEANSKNGFAGQIPEANTADPVTGVVITEKTRKALIDQKAGTFATAVGRVFTTKDASPAEKAAVQQALTGGKDAIDDEILNKFASKIGKSMVGTPHGFNSEYAKYPELFAQPRFRVAVLNSLQNNTEKGTWYAYEGLAKGAVINENQRAREAGEEPNYNNIISAGAQPEEAILLQNAGTGYIPTKSLETMKALGRPVKNYVNLVESDDFQNLPPAEKEIMHRSAAKLTRAGLDAYIPMISGNIKANYIDVADGIKGQSTKRVASFFETRPYLKDKPWMMVADLYDGMDPMEAKEAVDSGNITIIENPELNRLEMVLSAGEYRVRVPLPDDYEAPEGSRLSAPGMRRF